MKTRIAVFGISDAILRVIRAEINPWKAQIVSFVDNDKTKQGNCFMNIPVVSLEHIELSDVDYFLVAALSAYEKVKQQLIAFGVPKEKIQVFVTEQLCEYCLGSIDDIDMDFIRNVYFEPEKMLGLVEKYQKIYGDYSRIPPFEQDRDDWFHKSNLISHACGGVVNGRRLMYSNSKEAFAYSMEQGFRLIECDVLGLPDGELVLAHDYWRFYEAEEEGYSLMSVRDLLLLLKEYPQVSCLFDVKWENHEAYIECLSGIEKILENVCDNKEIKDKLKRQIIMEVYNESTIVAACQKGFDVIFTQYRNPDMRCFMSTVNICYKYGIKVVALAYFSCYQLKKFLPIIKSKGIHIFCFSSDSVSEYVELRQMGINGIFTNFLVEKDLREDYETVG